VSLHDKDYYRPVKNHQIQEKKCLTVKLSLQTTQKGGNVIREEIRVGNFSVSNSASKRNYLIMAV
jgi:hypothetical protein